MKNEDEKATLRYRRKNGMDKNGKYAGEGRNET